MNMTRRGFIKQAGLMVTSGLMVSGMTASGLLVNLAFAQPAEKPPVENPEEEVSPAEDLMREHGALDRLLMVYEACNQRLQATADPLACNILLKAIRLNRDFVENYHEKLEERYLFPRLLQAGKEAMLVNTLLAQHQAGRRLTDSLLQLSPGQILQDAATREATGQMLTQYIRMYRPHAAREDTVLFPAFKSIVPEHEYLALGEQFEAEEHRLFGTGGFQQVVSEISELEKPLDIYDLAGFTPPV